MPNLCGDHAIVIGAGMGGLTEAATEVHALMLGARHLLTPAAALRDPDLARREQMEMADA
jgi:hypothetical protein